jgi:hypothetical protein
MPWDEQLELSDFETGDAPGHQVRSRHHGIQADRQAQNGRLQIVPHEQHLQGNVAILRVVSCRAAQPQTASEELRQRLRHMSFDARVERRNAGEAHVPHEPPHEKQAE